MAKVGTSNSDRTIILRLQCVVKEHNGAYEDYDLIKCDDVNHKLTAEVASSTEMMKSFCQF